MLLYQPKLDKKMLLTKVSSILRVSWMKRSISLNRISHRIFESRYRTTNNINTLYMDFTYIVPATINFVNISVSGLYYPPALRGTTISGSWYFDDI